MLPRRRLRVVGSWTALAYAAQRVSGGGRVRRSRVSRVSGSLADVGGARPACAWGRSRLLPRVDPAARAGGYDDGMASTATPIASRLRLPVLVQDVLLAVFVTLLQIVGTRRAAPGPRVASSDDEDPSVPQLGEVVVVDGMQLEEAAPRDPRPTGGRTLPPARAASTTHQGPAQATAGPQDHDKHPNPPSHARCASRQHCEPGRASHVSGGDGCPL